MKPLSKLDQAMFDLVEDKQALLQKGIKLGIRDGLRLKQINEEVWGDFREKLLKKAKTRQEKEDLIAFWNLY